MSKNAVSARCNEIYALIVDALEQRLRGTELKPAACVLGLWEEPGGEIVLHVNSGGNALAVMHALWRHCIADLLSDLNL